MSPGLYPVKMWTLDMTSLCSIAFYFFFSPEQDLLQVIKKRGQKMTRMLSMRGQ